MRFRRFPLALILLLALTLPPAHASNTHGNPAIPESNMRDYDLDGAMVSSGCVIATAASTTLAAFACKGYVADASTGQLIYVSQASAAVGPLTASNATYWLAIHADISASVSGWTRQVGTHYIWKASSTQPANPARGLVFASATVTACASCAITSVGMVFPTSPVSLDVGISVMDPGIGAVCDGATDDSTALQRGLDRGGTLIIPSGKICAYASRLDMNVTGQRLVGVDRQTSTMYPTAAGASIRMRAPRQVIQNLTVDGHDTVTNPIQVYSARYGIVREVTVVDGLGTGLLMDCRLESPDGNANFFKAENSVFSRNNVDGIEIIAGCPDKNSQLWVNVEAVSNTRNGMLLRGTHSKVIGGNFDGNGEDGIQIGDAADGGTTQYTQIMGAWAETNVTTGFHYTSQAVNNLLITGAFNIVDDNRTTGTNAILRTISNNGFSLGNADTPVAGTGATWGYVRSSGVLEGTNRGAVFGASGEGPDVPLWVRGEGAGSTFLGKASSITGAPRFTSDGTLVQRTTQVQGGASGTIDLSAGNVWTLDFSAPTTVTAITCVANQMLYLRATNANATIQDNASQFLAGDFVMGTNDTITLLCVTGNVVYELARSNN